MSWEPISPELALVDPELAERARAALSEPVPSPRAARPPVRATPAPPAPYTRDHRSYPFWARVTAALWLVVLGILVGGAAIPHAQDKPRVVPKKEDAKICDSPQVQTSPNAPPRPFGP
jgi:hypothetical protein